MILCDTSFANDCQLLSWAGKLRPFPQNPILFLNISAIKSAFHERNKSLENYYWWWDKKLLFRADVRSLLEIHMTKTSRLKKGQLLFEYPTVLNTPTVLMISPHMHHDIPPRYSNFKGWYPPRYWTPSTVLMISPHVHHDIPHVHHDIPPRYWTSPTVLKITPHGTHNIPHGTEHPPRYSRYPPTFIMISPTVLNTPTVLKISPHGTQDIPPRYSWYPPTVLNTPTVLHTHYTGCLWLVPDPPLLSRAVKVFFLRTLYRLNSTGA